MNITARYVVAVYDWSVELRCALETYKLYYFADFSDALASFVTTYSKVGKITHYTRDGITRVWLSTPTQTSDQVGQITPLDKVFVYDKPNHF